jgi:hypothetical protein
MLLAVDGAWLRHFRTVTATSVHGEFGRPLPYSWSGFEAVVAWVRTHTPADSRVASGHDAFYALYTGRRAVRPWIHRPENYTPAYGAYLAAPEEPDMVLAELDRLEVCYLIIDPLLEAGEGEYGRRRLDALLTNDVRAWRLVFSTSASDHHVWIRQTDRCRPR